MYTGTWAVLLRQPTCVAESTLHARFCCICVGSSAVIFCSCGTAGSAVVGPLILCDTCGTAVSQPLSLACRPSHAAHAAGATQCSFEVRSALHFIGVEGRVVLCQGCVGPFAPHRFTFELSSLDRSQHACGTQHFLLPELARLRLQPLMWRLCVHVPQRQRLRFSDANRCRCECCTPAVPPTAAAYAHF